MQIFKKYLDFNITEIEICNMFEWLQDKNHINLIRQII